MPMFNRNIRDYPHFKTDFIKQVQSHIQKQETAAYTLKACLTDIPYDLVKIAHHDLAHIKVGHELSNNTSLLEEKLPKNIRRDWSKKVDEKDNRIDDTKRFPTFLDFLLEQKRIIKYESAHIQMRKMGLSRQSFHLHNEE